MVYVSGSDSGSVALSEMRAEESSARLTETGDAMGGLLLLMTKIEIVVGAETRSPSVAVKVKESLPEKPKAGL